MDRERIHRRILLKSFDFLRCLKNSPLKSEKGLDKSGFIIYNTNVIDKCVDEDRESLRFSESRRWVRDGRRAFLTHLGAIFSKSFIKGSREERLPPLSALSGVF